MAESSADIKGVHPFRSRIVERSQQVAVCADLRSPPSSAAFHRSTVPRPVVSFRVSSALSPIRSVAGLAALFLSLWVAGIT